MSTLFTAGSLSVSALGLQQPEPRRFLVNNTSQHPAFFITSLLRISGGRSRAGRRRQRLNFRRLWFPDAVCLFSKTRVRFSLKIPHQERGSSAEPWAERVKAAAGRGWFSNTTCVHSTIPCLPPKMFTFRFCLLSSQGKCWHEFWGAGGAWPSGQHSSPADPLNPQGSTSAFQLRAPAPPARPHCRLPAHRLCPSKTQRFLLFTFFLVFEKFCSQQSSTQASSQSSRAKTCCGISAVAVTQTSAGGEKEEGNSQLEKRNVQGWSLSRGEDRF